LRVAAIFGWLYPVIAVHYFLLASPFREERGNSIGGYGAGNVAGFRTGLDRRASGLMAFRFSGGIGTDVGISWTR
jgi:hypothetical protein